MSSPAYALRQRLEGGLVVAPGVYDGFSAMIARHLGAEAVYVSGYCVAASRWGLPDVGIVGRAEMVEAIRVVAGLVDVPVIADADTGYGGLTNVFQTVREYERCGVAAIQIEDQQMPKKCGHTPGKRVVEASEMAAKVEVARQACCDPDTVVVARTDARATHGLEEAIGRAALYRRAGADICFVEAPHSVDEVKAIVDALDAPLLVNMVPPTSGFRGLDITVEGLAELGVAVAIFPLAFAGAATDAMATAWRETLETGLQPVPASPGSPTLHELVGFGPVWEREQRWAERYQDADWPDALD